MTGDAQPPWRHLIGLGFEFFGTLFGLVFLGALIDRHFDTSPWGVLICAALGIFAGLYNLIHTARKAFSESAPARQEDEEQDDDALDQPVPHADSEPD